MLGCGWRGDQGASSQSLSEPTADEPFRFLLGALGLESSSSWRRKQRLMRTDDKYVIIKQVVNVFVLMSR